MKNYEVGIQMFGIEFSNIKAKTKAEAKKKAIAKLQKQIRSFINKVYVEEV